MSAKRFALLVLIAAFALLTSVVSPLSARAKESAPLPGVSIQERDLHDHLEALDRALSEQLERLEQLRPDGGLPGEGSRSAAAELRAHLRALDASLRDWDGEQADTLRGAAVALSRRAEGLRRLAAASRAPSGTGEPAAGLDPDAVWVGGTGAPSNDACSAAVPVGSGTFTGDTSAATSDGADQCSTSSYSNDVWFRYAFTADGYVTADTLGSEYDTVISVHEGCPGTAQNAIACNDNADGLQSSVTFYATAGVEYLIRVAGWADSAGPYTLNVGPRGGISGTVTGSATGQPLPFVRLVATSDYGYWVGSDTTDVAGEYAIDGLDPGTYFVHVDRSFGHEAELFDDLPCPAGDCEPSAGTPIGVSLGLITGGVGFALDLGGVIAGTVTDAETGEPIPSVDVVAADPAGVAQWVGQTDSQGAYFVHGLPAGRYVVYTFAADHGDELYGGVPCPGGPPGGCDPAAGTAIEISGSETVAGIDFALEVFGFVAGTVTDRATGQPLRWIDVEAYDDGGTRVRSTYTDGLGQYRIGGLPAGSYFLRTTNYDGYRDELYDDLPCPRVYPRCDPTAGTPVPVILEGDTTSIDFALDRLGVIAGTVTDEIGGQPLPLIPIRIHDRDGATVGYDSTDGSGEFHEAGLQPGEYFVRTDSRSHVDELYDGLTWTDATDPTTGTPVAVALAATTGGIDFAIRRAGSISGTVLGPAGPVYRGWIEVLDSNGELVERDYPDVQGRFSVTGLSAGAYLALTSFWDHLDQLYDGIPCERGDCDVQGGTPIAVSLGEDSAGIDFFLDPGASISGTVTDAVSGEPLTVAVSLHDANGDWVASSYAYSGRFELTTLPAGTYFARTESDVAHADLLWDGVPCPEACDPTTGTPITVTAQSIVTGIDFALEQLPVGAISGRLIHAHNGLPLRTSIVLWDAAGEIFQTAYSDYDGRYFLDRLPADTYTAGVEAPGFVGELFDGITCPGGVSVDCQPGDGTPIVVRGGELTSGVDFVLTPQGASCVPSDTRLCLNGGRFRADVLWTDAAGHAGFGTGRTITDDTGYFWFFDEDNVELVVKVLDACVDPFQRFWVFGGGLTNVRTILTITDTLTGAVKIYDNPLGTPFQPITDTDAFATCGPGSSVAGEARSAPELAPAGPAMTASSTPTPSAAPAKNLNGGRFAVEIGWIDFEGATGTAVGEMLTDDTGYYWFFDADNVEVVVKVLDACDLAPFHNFWVFAAGLTDVEVSLVVRDTVSGEERTYLNPLGSPFQPIQDVGAFDTCP